MITIMFGRDFASPASAAEVATTLSNMIPAMHLKALLAEGRDRFIMETLGLRWDLGFT
jgi:hypothetical protein